MRIKLHNSLGKMDEDGCYIFDDKFFINYIRNHLYIPYQIDDLHYFLFFSTNTKELEECLGFGKNYKMTNPRWWKDPIYDWKEMGQ